MIAEKVYKKPVVLSHQPLQFETRHSWNPGTGNNPDSDGNGGIKFPVETNPNPQPCGAGTANDGNSNGNGGTSGGIGQCNPNVN
ncbi:hypothetical protein FB550_108144 [Neobacillus bataviensis]|uniref:Uncharacterized protein n=1 Tax=Neobacillus bataviensis TaxID=220685 RepID=A0A561D619_9BACI|nr:hypothetical protein [Neobacillus bataviensis]TWD98889.1 hypothetical protein FB550_108144 [Neobacillus bataviensis]